MQVKLFPEEYFEMIEYIPADLAIDYKDTESVYLLICQWFRDIYQQGGQDIPSVKRLASFIKYLPYTQEDIPHQHTYYYTCVLNGCLSYLWKDSIDPQAFTTICQQMRISSAGVKGVFLHD